MSTSANLAYYFLVFIFVVCIALKRTAGSRVNVKILNTVGAFCWIVGVALWLFEEHKHGTLIFR